jgi:hypothetical protein
MINSLMIIIYLVPKTKREKFFLVFFRMAGAGRAVAYNEES